MRKLLMTVSLTACLFGHASSRAEETYASRRETSPDDSKAILQVLTNFMDAIKTKNPFLRAGTVSNHGVETWQMFKPDGKTWKILSVVWSSHVGS